jgi:hypothetical protein
VNNTTASIVAAATELADQPAPVYASSENVIVDSGARPAITPENVGVITGKKTAP